REVAAQIDHEERVRICCEEGGAENSGAKCFGQSAKQRKRGEPRERLHEQHEQSGNPRPRKYAAQRRAEHPGKWRIKNEPRLAEPVICPLSPSWIDNSLFPLAGGVNPRLNMKLNVVPGSGA